MLLLLTSMMVRDWGGGGMEGDGWGGRGGGLQNHEVNEILKP